MKFWMKHLMNKAARIIARRKSFNKRMNKKLAKVRSAMKDRGNTRFLVWREEMYTMRRKYYNAKADMRLALICRSQALADDYDWAKSAKRAIRLADRAIDSYDDAVLLDESNYVFGWTTMAGKVGWTLLLSVIELVLILLLCMLIASFGIELTLAIGIFTMLAVCIPMDVMFSKGLFSKPFVMLKMLRVKMARNRMAELLA